MLGPRPVGCIRVSIRIITYEPIMFRYKQKILTQINFSNYTCNIYKTYSLQYNFKL